MILYMAIDPIMTYTRLQLMVTYVDLVNNLRGLVIEYIDDDKNKKLQFEKKLEKLLKRKVARHIMLIVM